MLSWPSFRLLFVTLAFSATLGACRKKQLPTELPAVTQSGQNTLGFKYDGALFIPYCACSNVSAGSTQLSFGVVSQSNTSILPITFGVFAQDHRSGVGTFHINLKSGTRSYIYAHPGNLLDSLEFLFTPPGGPDYTPWSFVHPSTDHFTISKLDTVHGILSGTFQFTVHAQAPPSTRYKDSLLITDGRFDFQFGVHDVCTD